MAAIINKVWFGYKLVFEELTDPRTRDWFLVAKPYQGVFILGIYLMFVLKWGPKWMKNRPPFNLEKLLIVYNVIQVLSCAYILYYGLICGWLREFKWICEPVDYSNNEKAIIMAKMTYYYYLLKIFDLLDTVFFVLRKKLNQVSFLHVYHHAGMVMLIWGAATYFPGGHGSLIGVINSFVHVVMYTYYLLSVAMPSVKQALWFKKLITLLQIFQFLWFVFHMGVVVFKPDCEYPRWISAVFLPQNIFMLILFTDFYIKTYIKKSKPQPSSQTNGKRENGLNGQSGVVKSKTENGHGIEKKKVV